MGVLNKITIPHPDFKLDEIIDPEQFDENNLAFKSKLDQIVDESNAQNTRLNTIEADQITEKSQLVAITGKASWNIAPSKSIEQLVARDAEITTDITNLKGVGYTNQTVKGIYDLATTANINSTSAVDTANQANTTANQANTKADNAVNIANTANTSATSAVNVANQALTKATQVEDDYNTMKPQLEQAVLDVYDKASMEYVDNAVAQVFIDGVPDGAVTDSKLATTVSTKLNTAYSVIIIHNQNADIHVTKDGVLQTNLNADLLDGKHSFDFEPSNVNIQQHITSAHAPSNAQKNSDITKAEIEAKLTGAITTHTHSYEPIDSNIMRRNVNQTMTAIITAQNNTSYATKQVRNVFLSTANPSGGGNGDIWLKYKP